MVDQKSKPKVVCRKSTGKIEKIRRWRTDSCWICERGKVGQETGGAHITNYLKERIDAKWRENGVLEVLE